MYYSCPFVQGDLGYAEDIIILGYVPKFTWTFITRPRLYSFSVWALGPNLKVGQGHELLGPTIL